MISLPSQADLDSFSKIPILVVPPELKDFVYDETLLLVHYIEQHWKLHSVGTARDRLSVLVILMLEDINMY